MIKKKSRIGGQLVKRRSEMPVSGGWTAARRRATGCLAALMLILLPGSISSAGPARLPAALPPSGAPAALPPPWPAAYGARMSLSDAGYPAGVTLEGPRSEVTLTFALPAEAISPAELRLSFESSPALEAQ